MWREVGRSAAAAGPASSQSARVAIWATAKWVVQAQVLSQQDDQCAQSRLVGEPLAQVDQGLGPWRACDEPFGRSSNRVRSTRVFKGGLTSQVWRPLHPGLLRLRGCMTCEYATSRAKADGFKAENAAFLLVQDRAE
jgi:hypothetical protein